MFLLETILITGLGGLLFSWLHLPLAWMLGPLTAVLLWKLLTKRTLSWPTSFRNGGLIVLGYSIGLSFTMQSAMLIVKQLPFMLVGTVLLITVSLLIAYAMARLTGISYATSVIGHIPGGLSSMVPLSEEVRGADPGTVAFLQTVRLLTVIFTVSFIAVHGLAGGSGAGFALPLPAAGSSPAAEAGLLAWAAQLPWPVSAAACVMLAPLTALAASRLRLPTPWFFGPLLLAGALTVLGAQPATPPHALILAAQWSLGIYLGLGIKLSALGQLRRMLPLAIGGSLLLVGCALALAYALSALQHISLVTAFLSLSPGGMKEMGVTASAVGADASLVVVFQLFRTLFILFVIPFALSRVFRPSEEQQGVAAER